MNHFGETLLNELKMHYPSVDVDAIARQVDAMPDVRSPVALLRARVRGASTGVGPRRSDPPPAGSFRPDGSWDSGGDGDNPVTQFVWHLCRMRREQSDFTPAGAVALIVASRYGCILTDEALEQWQSLDPAFPTWMQWAQVRSTNAAETAIKHGGHGKPFGTPDGPVLEDQAKIVEIMEGALFYQAGLALGKARARPGELMAARGSDGGSDHLPPSDDPEPPPAVWKSEFDLVPNEDGRIVPIDDDDEPPPAVMPE